MPVCTGSTHSNGVGRERVLQQREKYVIALCSTHRSGFLLIFVLVLLTACVPASPAVTASSTMATGASPTPIIAIPPPAHYTSHLLLHGGVRPDDLAFDQQKRLLFSDEFAGTISRLNADGSVTVLLRDQNGPEGFVVRPDGTILFAEQDTNRIMSLAPGASTPVILHQLPGIASKATCKHGVDGIAFDATNNTLIVPDSPSGTVYRMSLDGKTLTLLASGIVRPVGAAVDNQSNIYIADECGHAIWRITPAGKTTRIGGFGMPDDVALDGYGNVLIIDLDLTIHALLRLNPTTGQHETLARQGFIEPQGLVIDTHGNIYVSDDYADSIVEFMPVFS